MTRREKLEAVLENPSDILKIFPRGADEMHAALWEEVLEAWGSNYYRVEITGKLDPNKYIPFLKEVRAAGDIPLKEAKIKVDALRAGETICVTTRTERQARELARRAAKLHLFNSWKKEGEKK